MLRALMVQDNWQSEYGGIEDFTECRIDHSEVCMPKGDGSEHIWNNSIKDQYVKQKFLNYRNLQFLKKSYF